MGRTQTDTLKRHGTMGSGTAVLLALLLGTLVVAHVLPAAYPAGPHHSHLAARPTGKAPLLRHGFDSGRGLHAGHPALGLAYAITMAAPAWAGGDAARGEYPSTTRAPPA